MCNENELLEEGANALSRKDNETEICSECGTVEAMEEFGLLRTEKRVILSLDQWANIFRNLAENDEEVEVIWLDGSDEWCLCFETEMFEDGFATEKEAQMRLDEVVRLLAERED